MEKNKGKIIFDVFLVLLIVYCLLADALFVYFKFFMPDKITEDVAYIGEMVDNVDNRKQVFEVVYYENADKSGQELFEIKTNYFTDYEKNEIYSSGVQYVGKPEFEIINPYTMIALYRTNRNQYYVKNNVYFYNTDNNTNISYKRDKRITNNDFYTIEIGEEIYKLSFSEYVYQKGALYTNWKINNIYSFSFSLYTAVKSLPYGDSVIEFKFQDVFDIFKFDKTQKDYVKANDADIFSTYVYIKVSRHKEGARVASDSIFKCVAGNANWMSADVDLTKDYTFNETYYILTENDMNFKYDNTKGYHVGSLNKAAYDYFKDKNTSLKLIIDNDKLIDYSIVFGDLNSLYFEELGITSYTLIENGVKSEVAL